MSFGESICLAGTGEDDEFFSDVCLNACFMIVSTLIENGFVRNRIARNRKDFLRRIKTSDRHLLVIFYGGHGSKTGLELVFDEEISWELLLETISSSKAKDVILILDCCYAGYIEPIASRFFKDCPEKRVLIQGSCYKEQSPLQDERLFRGANMNSSPFTTWFFSNNSVMEGRTNYKPDKWDTTPFLFCSYKDVGTDYWVEFEEGRLKFIDRRHRRDEVREARRAASVGRKG